MFHLPTHCVITVVFRDTLTIEELTSFMLMLKVLTLNSNEQQKANISSTLEDEGEIYVVSLKLQCVQKSSTNAPST